MYHMVTGISNIDIDTNPTQNKGPVRLRSSAVHWNHDRQMTKLAIMDKNSDSRFKTPTEYEQ